MVALYALSMACFTISFLHALRIILADPVKYWRLLLTTLFFSSALWLLLFVGGSEGLSSLPRSASFLPSIAIAQDLALLWPRGLFK